MTNREDIDMYLGTAAMPSVHCPFCGSDDVGALPPREGWDAHYCHHCERSWDEGGGDGGS